MTSWARPLRSGGWGNPWLLLGMCVAVGGLLVGSAALIRHNEANAQRVLTDRFETRATLTASFARNYVNDLADRERRQAGRLLAGGDVDQVSFESLVGSFEFEAAVLLDDHGRLLHVWPAKPALRGRDMTETYTHLRDAVAGKIGVSGSVPSAARGEPVAAVAVPYNTAKGRRVFSGAFSPATTPLGSYLDSVVPISGGSAYLVDRSGNLLANASGATHIDVVAHLPAGVVEIDTNSGQVIAAAADVPGLPWRVVLVAPSEGLFAPVGAERFASWALWWALAGSGCIAIVLVVRLGRARTREVALARIDPLTGLPNRRAMQEALDKAGALTSRHGVPLAALMIDIDRFKAVNDAHGHDVGDLVLQATAAALVESTRKEDIAGRWGGEEFLVLLQHTGFEAVQVVAERVRHAIATAAVPQGCEHVTASIGIGVFHDGETAMLLRDADAALYAAKANGRDRVEACFPLPHGTNASEQSRIFSGVGER